MQQATCQNGDQGFISGVVQNHAQQKMVKWHSTLSFSIEGRTEVGSGRAVFLKKVCNNMAQEKGDWKKVNQ